MNAKTPIAAMQSQLANADKFKDKKRYMWLLSPALPLIGVAAATGYAIAPKKLRFLSAFGPIMLHGVKHPSVETPSMASLPMTI